MPATLNRHLIPDPSLRALASTPWPRTSHRTTRFGPAETVRQSILALGKPLSHFTGEVD